MEKINLAYCDYIAARLHTLIDRELTDNQTMIESVSQPRMDLHPTEGYFQSTKKALTVHDINGKAYVITVQEAPLLDKDAA
jgi:hypothetical protein